MNIIPRRKGNPMTWPKRTPKVIPNWQSTPVAPLRLSGEISVKYIGITAVTKPKGKFKKQINVIILLHIN